jgi:hypothetical protein
MLDRAMSVWVQALQRRVHREWKVLQRQRVQRELRLHWEHLLQQLPFWLQELQRRLHLER